MKGRVQGEWKVYTPDDDAEYVEEYEIDLSALKPTVSFPHLPENTKTIDEVGDVPIQQVVIGSCTNGRLEDMALAAKILKGRKVHDDVRAIIIPATQQIYKDCIKNGYIDIVHRCRMRRIDTDMRTMSRRTHGHPGSRGEMCRNDQQKLRRKNGTCKIRSLSGKPGCSGCVSCYRKDQRTGRAVKDARRRKI